jgi:predicted esterase
MFLVSVNNAQDLRYELGARLRMFERDFEGCASPEARAVPLDSLNNCVQLFFGLKMLNALQELDAARVAIQPEKSRSILEQSINMQLKTSSRLLDPALNKLECIIEPMYGQGQWNGLSLVWQVQPYGSVQPYGADSQKAAAVSVASMPKGSHTFSDDSQVAFSIPLEALSEGDYLLHLSVAKTESSPKEADPVSAGIPIASRMFSLAPDASSRVEKLAADFAGLDASLDATQVASLNHNIKTLKKIVDGSPLETDFPAAQILGQSERALQQLSQGQTAYGNGQPGEYWMVAATPSGQKWLRLRAPQAAALGKPLPLVLALHGAGGSENMFFDTYGDGKVVKLAEQRQWLLVAPRVTMGGIKLDELVNAIDGFYPVDRQSIYVVGHSMGAAAAVAATGGATLKPLAVAALGGGRAVADPSPFQSVPFWIAAGSHDFGKTGAKQLYESLKRGGITAEYHEYKNVEHLGIVQVALDDVFQFFERSKPVAQQAPAQSQSGQLRINHLQLVGTHNSYHLAPDVFAMKTISAVVPREAKSIDNSQRALSEQFELLGVRHIELDLYLDPEGKLFSAPFAYVQAKKQQVEVPEFDPQQKMQQPGIKVLHSPDFDYRTTVYTLVDALREIKAWSDGNRFHVPIFVLLEMKSDSFSPMTRPLPWTIEAFRDLESEILSVFPRDRILAPDDVRGSAPTLREAVEGIGWPSVDSQRGKIAFLLDNEGSLAELYLTRSPILEGCLLFTSVQRDHPAAAWFKRNDPVGSFDEIVDLVRSGFLVRTRSDVGTVQSRNNDPSQRDKAIASGAQLISTDYPEPDPRFSDYHLTLPLPNETAPSSD